MCDPVTLAIAGTAIAAAGSVTQGVNASRQAGYEAKVAEQNASLDREAAKDARERGAIEEARQYRRNAQLLGQQRTSLAANGLEVDFGSAADIQLDTKAIGWEDAQTIRENAIRESKGFEISASNNVGKAASSRASGQAAIIGAAFDAGSTILSGASQVRKLQAAKKAA